MAPSSDGDENYVIAVRAIPFEKTLKTSSKSAYERQRNACSNFASLERMVLRTRSMTNLKQKHRPIKDNAYRQDIVTRTPITRVELITISTVTIRSIWHNSLAIFLRFCKFMPQICEFAQPTDGTTKPLVR